MNKKILTYVAALALSIGCSYAEKTKISGTDGGTTANPVVQYAPVMVPAAVAVNQPTVIAEPTVKTPVASPIVTTATPGFWHRLGSGTWHATKWTCSLPHRVPTYLLTQLFKLPGLNLLFGEKTAQVVSALGLLALCLYNPVALSANMAITASVIQKMMLVLTVCGVTECICKILTSLHNKHPYVLWLFAPAIIVLLSATLYANSYGIRDIAMNATQKGLLKGKELVTQTIEQLPSYITQPARQGYRMILELLGYPTEAVAMVENCRNIMPWKSSEECVQFYVDLKNKANAQNITTAIPAEMNSSPSYVHTLVNSMNQQVRATTDIIKKSATSTAKAIWNGAKDMGQRLKAFCNKHKVSGVPSAEAVGLCTAEFSLPTSQCAALLTR